MDGGTSLRDNFSALMDIHLLDFSDKLAMYALTTPIVSTR
jgi:hypothetical protein